MPSIGAVYFCRRILVALDLAQRIVGSIENELRWVVAKEALAHVHDRLDGRSLRGLVDNRPVKKISLVQAHRMPILVRSEVHIYK
jgi:hypothetical protein